MPKSSLHVFIWSEKQQRYELQSHGHSNQWFHPGEEPAFTRWLEEHASFAFVGQAERLSVIKEARSGGRGYWYAYHKQARHTRKGYLGPSAQVTFARLEELASARSKILMPFSRRQADQPLSMERLAWGCFLWRHMQQSISQNDTSSNAKLTRVLLSCSVVAGPLYVIVGVIETFTRPGYNPTRDDLSLMSNHCLARIKIK